MFCYVPTSVTNRVHMIKKALNKWQPTARNSLQMAGEHHQEWDPCGTGWKPPPRSPVRAAAVSILFCLSITGALTALEICEKPSCRTGEEWALLRVTSAATKRRGFSLSSSHKYFSFPRNTSPVIEVLNNWMNQKSLHYNMNVVRKCYVLQYKQDFTWWSGDQTKKIQRV